MYWRCSSFRNSFLGGHFRTSKDTSSFVWELHHLNLKLGSYTIHELLCLLLGCPAARASFPFFQLWCKKKRDTPGPGPPATVPTAAENPRQPPARTASHTWASNLCRGTRKTCTAARSECTSAPSVTPSWLAWTICAGIYFWGTAPRRPIDCTAPCQHSRTYAQILFFGRDPHIFFFFFAEILSARITGFRKRPVFLAQVSNAGGVGSRLQIFVPNKMVASAFVCGSCLGMFRFLQPKIIGPIISAKGGFQRMVVMIMFVS